MKYYAGKSFALALALGGLLGGSTLQARAQNLVYSTYLGGSGTDRAEDIAVDAAGNAWVIGTTASADFPTTADALDRTLDAQDVFLAKVSPGGALLYATFLGGSGTEVGLGLALDAAGNVYLTGHTNSADFPRVGGLPAAFRGAGTEIFVAKLSPSGSSLVYSTTFGGSGTDRGWRIAVDGAGAAYVTGETDSRDFPVAGGVQSEYGGGALDAFVAKLSPNGSALSYSTYLGGGGLDQARGLAVDAAGRAAVGGTTDSRDFPTGNAAQGGFQGGLTDAFATVLDPTGSALMFSTYLGGSLGNEAILGLAFAPDSTLYTAGSTSSPDFPLLSSFQSHRGNFDAFVTSLDRSGALLFSTLLGGGDGDTAFDVAAGQSGRISVSGATSSTDFPLKEPFQTTCEPAFPPLFTACGSNGFVAEIDPEGSGLLFSTYLGGAGFDIASSIAADSRGNLYVAGETSSLSFPTVNAFQPALGGGVDAFVAKISPDNQAPDCSGATASPGTLWPPNGKLVPVAIRGVVDPEGDPTAITVTSIRQDEPLSRAGTPDASGIGTATPRVRTSRAGGGDGRVYHVSFTATDILGLSCAGTVTVCVPHDRGHGATCGDGGPLVDSVQP